MAISEDEANEVAAHVNHAESCLEQAGHTHIVEDRAAWAALARAHQEQALLIRLLAIDSVEADRAEQVKAKGYYD